MVCCNAGRCWIVHDGAKWCGFIRGTLSGMKLGDERLCCVVCGEVVRSDGFGTALCVVQCVAL